METENKQSRRCGTGTPEAIYGLGTLGAWVWFWRAAEGFLEHVWAIVQGVFWPAYMVYDVFVALRG